MLILLHFMFIIFGNDLFHGSLAQSQNSLCPKPSGYFRDTHDCSIYYRCVEGEAKRSVCPLGQFFSPVYSVCVDWIRVTECNADGSSKVENMTCPSPNGYFRHPTDCQLYYRCIRSNRTLHRCSGSQVFNPIYQVCDNSKNASSCSKTPESTDFSCPQPHGYFRDDTNCNSYYRCIRGVSERMQCAAGLAFNPAYSTCNRASSVPGCEPDRKQPPPCAHGDGYYPDAHQCTIFYRCYLGQPIRFDCAVGTYFDENLGVCNHPAQVSQCDGDGIRSGGGGSTELFVCPVPCGRYPHITRCQDFVDCSGSVATVRSCPRGLLYNPDIGMCDWPVNVTCYRNPLTQ